LIELARLKNLKMLNIGGEDTTDAGAEHLARLSSLTHLTIDKSAMTADGFAELRHLPKLSSLTLIEPRLGDDGIEVLEGIPNLTSLQLEYYFNWSNIRPAALVRLMDRKPDLQIHIRSNGVAYGPDEIRELAKLRQTWGVKPSRHFPADAEQPANVAE
jgi:hypothetical protein